MRRKESAGWQAVWTARPIYRPSGQRMSYCNDGFGLLSDIVRRHSGYGSFSAYLKERIFKPLGMERSNISFLRNSLDENAATLYTLEDGTWRADMIMKTMPLCSTEAAP